MGKAESLKWRDILTAYWWPGLWGHSDFPGKTELKVKLSLLIAPSGQLSMVTATLSCVNKGVDVDVWSRRCSDGGWEFLQQSFCLSVLCSWKVHEYPRRQRVATAVRNLGRFGSPWIISQWDFAIAQAMHLHINAPLLWEPLHNPASVRHPEFVYFQR